MDNSIPTTTKHEEKDDPKKLGEMILNSPLWIVFRTDDKGSYMHHNSQDALILIANFLVENREIRNTMLAYIKERTKFEL